MLSYTDRTEGGRPPVRPSADVQDTSSSRRLTIFPMNAPNFSINDRLSFMRFLGRGLDDRVPDARTIWLFREKLTTAGAIKRLFEQFDAMLRQAGYIAMSGQIVDGSLVAAPRQRNTDDEKKAIKEDRIPANWKAKPAKLRHKDRDARWTVKFSRAKPCEDGSTPPVDLAIPLFGRSETMFRSIAVSASSADGRPQMWLPMRAVCLRQGLLDKSNTASGAWPIPRYRSAANETFLNETVRQPHPSQEAERPRYARDDAAGQQCEIENPLACRACVRRAKDRMELFIRTIGIARATTRSDGQSRLQHQTLYLPAQDRHRVTSLCYATRPIPTYSPICY